MTIRQMIVLLIVLALSGMGLGGGVAAFLSRGSAKEVKAVTEGVVPSALASVELMSQLKDVQIATLSMVSAPDADAEAVVRTQQDLADRKALLQMCYAPRKFRRWNLRYRRLNKLTCPTA